MQIQSNLTVLIAEKKLPSVNVIISSRKVLRSKRRTRNTHFGLTQVKAEPIRRFPYEEPLVKLEYRIVRKTRITLAVKTSTIVSRLGRLPVLRYQLARINPKSKALGTQFLKLSRGRIWLSRSI